MNKLLIIAFGSQVSGRSNDRSDFDFAVLADKSISLLNRSEISSSISRKFNINEDRIDIVDLSTASPILKFEVAQNGKLIDGEYSDFIRFKVKAFKEYVDTNRFRKIREKMISKNYA